jgi:CheY-like chemotaxis protein
MLPAASTEPVAKKAILLVEDEVLLCWVLEEALLETGYSVHTATTGNEGLAAIEKAGRLDFLVTNIRLEDGPSGWELARRARELNPGVPVLYVSGDSAALHEQEGVPGSSMLSKPFEPDQLQRTIAAILPE